MVDLEAIRCHREAVVRQAIAAHHEALQEQVSNEFADQRASIVQEAEQALAQERQRQAQVHSEYTKYMTDYQNEANGNLQQANMTISKLRHILQVNEQTQASLHNQISTMQNSMETQQNQLLQQVQLMQQRYDEQLKEVRHDRESAARDLKTEYSKEGNSIRADIQS